MATELSQAYLEAAQLAGDFQAHRLAYLKPEYSEAQVRQDFIDKLLALLGWDVSHNVQKNPFEQEVKVENRVQMGHTQRRADYAFFVGPNFRDVRFFVEAKKPSAQLATSDNYFQTIRYGWNSSTPIAALTDFNEFHVVDCRYKPNIDTALERGVLKFRVEDLTDAEKFAQIYYLFSREAVGNGALEKFAENLPKKRGKAIQRGLFKGGYQSIDDAFLEELDGYRETLARSLKIRNPELDGDALTELTQRILDRLVFLRFLEDKLIETKESVGSFGDKGSVWGDFIAASRHLDAVYNGIVFKRHPILDSPQLIVDDDVFSEICEKLADKNSPYNFDVIPIHILGSIYERFLGKVIVTTEKRAQVVDKPEVRKAGGVYYTPDYIVQYIVDSTVGKITAGKSPSQITGMRFADIACGSGSFLLGIYDHLLRYHRAWYNAHRSKARIGIDCVEHQDKSLHLSLRKKREILVNNVFGVDIDHQAVEVAQLSLYLKLLEEETTASARHYQLELHEAILPSLSKNIVCGNSLVGSEIFEDGHLKTKDQQRINPLDFKTAFKEIMTEGGFHAILGNPPYVNAWDFFEAQPEVREFLNKGTSYQTADRHWDLYVLFLERAFQLTRSGGRFAYIIPYSYALQKYGILSRRLLLSECTIDSIADIRTVQVFKDVPVITMIPSLTKEPPAAKQEIEIFKPSAESTKKRVCAFELSHRTPQRRLLEHDEAMLRLDWSKGALKLIKRLSCAGRTLGDICYVNYGAQMSSRIKGQFGKEHVIRAKATNSDCKPMIGGKELFSYEIRPAGRFVDWSFADQMYGPRWPAFFELPKLMIRDITGTHRVVSTLDRSGLYCDHTILCALRKCDVSHWKSFDDGDVAESASYDLRFLAGVIGSTAISAFFYLVLSGEGVRTGGGFHTYPDTIRSFPIPRIDPADKVRVAKANQVAELVDNLLELKKLTANAKTERDIEFFGKRVNAISYKIDELINDLFGLNAEDFQVALDAVGAPYADY